jgi:hypothetical protein
MADGEDQRKSCGRSERVVVKWRRRFGTRVELVKEREREREREKERERENREDKPR